MSKKTRDRLKKEIIKDITRTIEALYQMNVIRDYKGIAENKIGTNSIEISYGGKTYANNVLYDKHATASFVMDILLMERQYTVLLYDKSIIQSEFCLTNDELTKERLIFIKKHNRLFTQDEIARADAEDEPWFEDEDGIPVFLRIDYDPSSHVDCKHPVSHLTISNNETCRIPIQDAVTFSEFVRFILYHFYKMDLGIHTYRLEKEKTITRLEENMMHIGWC